MSGAQTSSLAGYLFAGFMIVSGLVQFFMPIGSRTWNDNLWAQRLAGALALLLGCLYLLHPPGFMHEPAFLFVMGGLALAMAFFILLIDPRIEARKLRRYEAQLSQMALAADDYSESLRAFHANSPFAQSPLRRWLGGGLLILFGLLWLTLGLIGARP